MSEKQSDLSHCSTKPSAGRADMSLNLPEAPNDEHQLGEVTCGPPTPTVVFCFRVWRHEAWRQCGDSRFNPAI